MRQPASSSTNLLRIGIIALLGLVAILILWSFIGRRSTPTPTQPTSALGGPSITILAPTGNSTVTSPIAISGAVSAVPPTGILNFRLFGADGSLLAQGAFAAQGTAGAPGTFTGSVPYTQATQSVGRIEVLELNASDGSILAIASVQVILPGPADGTCIDTPAIADLAAAALALGGAADLHRLAAKRHNGR
jgi:hypothetical protein